MPASYPTSAKVFTTKSDGPGNTILAAHINDLQLEVAAIENDLVTGLPLARGGTGLTSLAANRIPYGNGTSALQSSASLIFDGTTLTAGALAVTGATALNGNTTIGDASSDTLTLTAQIASLIDASHASGGQMKFPASQNASADANTLDDYEEGTWTPTIGGSGGQSGQAYSIQVGWYVKVGRLVTAGFRVQLSSLGTITTDVQVQGLPFASANVANQTASCALGRWQNFTSTYVHLAAVLAPNTTALTLSAATGTAVGLSLLVQADLSGTTVLEGTISYLAAS
jgi:hypothetical protein